MHLLTIRRTASAVAIVSLAIGLMPGPAAAEQPAFAPPPPGDLQLLSATPDGGKFPSDAGGFTMSADGGTVAFMVERERGPYGGDAYVRDVAGGQTRLVSTAADGTPANAFGESAYISGDGTMVAFSSQATNLLPVDTNGTYQIYVKNLATGALELASTSPDGAPREFANRSPVMSHDGRVVAFDATTRIFNGSSYSYYYSVLVKDLDTGVVTGIGTSDNGERPDYETDVQDISADGRLVLFDSYAAIDPGDTDGKNDVYLKDLVTGDIRLVTGAELASTSFGELSADGGTVAYAVSDADFRYVGYVVDLASGVVTRTNTTAAGVPGNGSGYPVALSANGTKVLLTDASTNLDPRSAGGRYAVYLKDLVSGSLELVSLTEAGRPPSDKVDVSAGDLSADGTLAILSTKSATFDPADPDRLFDGYLKAVGGLVARNPRLAEGNTGNRLVPFTITLSRPVTTRVTVAYATTDGTAVAGVDYLARTGRVSIPAGLRRTVVFITLLPDSTPEPDETFTLTLSAPSGAGIQNPTATATIANDD